MLIAKNKLAISKADSWKMFNDISPKYDLLNRLLSFGLDVHWRNQLVKFLPPRDHLKILDLATGTADVIISLFKNSPRVESGCGIDMAQRMVSIGRKKILKNKLDQKIVLKTGDAHQIPFGNESFDAVTIAFGIRNMTDYTQVLKEMERILKKGGRAIILEFSLPKNRLLLTLHLFYLRAIVPVVGFLFSGHYSAYRYLNHTIEEFPYGENFCRIIEEAGFVNAACHPIMSGIASIYIGDKD